MTSSSASIRPFLSLIVPLLGALVGCGHPATEAECQLLVDKNVELQIKAMAAPPPDVEKEKTRVRTEMEPLLKGCVGRRITHGMLACVRAANTIKEIDQCSP